MNTSDIDPRDGRLPDPAFDRLSAADPAAAADPDVSVIRAKVDSSISAVGAPVADLAAQRRARRPARWLQIAAAAAGVVAVGGGAFFAGQQSSGTPISAQSSATDTPSAPVAEPGAAPAQAGAGSAGSFAAGAQNESRSSMDMIGGSFGRTVFTAEGLSGATASAQAWGYDPAAVFTSETAARLAAALGVAGDPALYYGSWHVGSVDWTEASVDLSSDGLTSFYFNNPAIAPWSENATMSGASADDATAAVTDLMAALGVDPAGYTITTDTQDPRSTAVVANPVQAGDGNGAWYASVTTDGLASLNGSLAPLVDLGSYDVVSPQAAVGRLGDARFGATQQAIPYAMGDFARGVNTLEIAPDSMAVTPDDPAAVPTLPGTAVPGGSIAWPVTNVTITGATLGAGTYFQPDGSVALLPTYTLTGADGTAWTVLAVADAHLNFAATS